MLFVFAQTRKSFGVQASVIANMSFSMLFPTLIIESWRYGTHVGIFLRSQDLIINMEANPENNMSTTISLWYTLVLFKDTYHFHHIHCWTSPCARPVAWHYTAEYQPPLCYWTERNPPRTPPTPFWKLPGTGNGGPIESLMVGNSNEPASSYLLILWCPLEGKRETCQQRLYITKRSS